MNKTVTITGIPKVMREFQEINDFLRSPKPMKGIVADIKTGITEKTAAGHDYKGRNFAPYSDAYKGKRSKAGLTTKPDLRVTGTMIDSITAEVIDPRHGRVAAPPVSDGKIGADMLAQIHNTGTGKQPQREFMNITDNALKVITKRHYDDPILEIVRKYR